ncbi:MAG TPA: UDP-4-amino-4,6-dideoxy-N-acetyl-beta-L-altrosamine transaminase [Sulfuricurvum sp.]|nr:MAG: UDP-4-amino-4,6-dideoxy-N-acetyl-beta-L-altrosamine transaminase [Campylobacterales bacterium 16-40-21]OZA03468.1 MAG: UDP-4-amino-4,6-dideoxy-N-acetyl-beta-L-altrosamine transaminase [Sulfuricurvum sp. 17-40-25]HQS66658.1 UDP-4-amino-4,6-dideoxy-N-acetyl-beta-L-altrosamine transaminase [Sulfuricurvum sp.]HQT36514.1 UDP-4-amino-4,6-dideoxy-N-acetyl-beta-L-altrosamine transaminase [Sulfuricurvum sp.]
MLPYSTQFIEEDDIAAVVDILRSSHLTQGLKVQEFEEAIAHYVGAKYCITFNSATSALLGAYSVCPIGEDDEIITTPISFVATSNMAIALGAKPVFCDIKMDGNIDESLIEALITPRTKAIVSVDFAGKPVTINAIKAIAKKHNLITIDDASHALGSDINQQKIGSFADMTIFSFHAIKPITTGEGGAVVTDNEEYAKNLRLFRSHGIIKKQLWNSDMVSLGHNFRMTEFAAALGLSQLHKIDRFINVRETIARYYDELFENHKLFSTIHIDAREQSARHLYPILLNPELHCVKEEIFSELQQKSIGVQVHYKPIYQNSFYQKRFGQQRLQTAELFYKSELSIPCHQKMSIEDAKHVADTLLAVIEKYAYRGCSF